MIVGVADTHVAIWYLYDDPKLSRAASDFIDGAVRSGGKIAISSISLIEIVYLVEKNRIPTSALEDLEAALENENHVFKEAPFTKEVVKVMRRVSREEVPDMPDRVVAATALYLGVPVISKDRRIQASSVQSIW